MLSFNIDKELNRKLTDLNNKFTKIYAQTINYSHDTINAIHKYAKISMTGASTRIENAVLTDLEVAWIDTLLTKDGHQTSFQANLNIIENKLSKDKERSIEEVAGCRQMLELIYTQSSTAKPLTAAFIRGLHFELMQYYPKAHSFMGKYKIQSNSVIETNKANNKKNIIFQTADAGPVTESSMNDLIQWYNTSCLIDSRTIAIACEFTYRFLAIHPFQDGNGRLGRGMFLSLLLQSDNQAIANVAPLIAIDRKIEQLKSEYYYVLNKCSNGKYKHNPKEYNIHYFVQFIVKILNLALDDVLLYKQKFDDYQLLSPSSKKILNAFNENPQIYQATKQIIELTKLPRRTISHCLTTLTKKQFLQKMGQGAGVRYQLIF